MIRSAFLLFPVLCAWLLLLDADASNVPPGLVMIEGGTLVMQEVNWHAEPVGVARVTHISRFQMGRTEVTQGEWERVRAWALTNGYDIAPGRACGPDHPIQRFSWHDAVKWCNAKSEMEGLQPAYYTHALTNDHAGIYRAGVIDLRADHVAWDAGYRLPTEAEWEFAARGGGAGRNHAYSGSDQLDEVAWYVLNSASKGCDMAAGHGTHPVAQKRPNELGLYDMSGNVWEWCWDWRAPYAASEITDPRGPDTGTHRIVRGGGWMGGAPYCHIAFRTSICPGTADCLFGLRYVLGDAPPALDTRHTRERAQPIPPRDPPSYIPLNGKALTPAPPDTVIQRGDTLTLFIPDWEFEDAPPTMIFTVNVSDGLLVLPVIGPVSAAGRTMRDLEEELLHLLRENNILANPRISLSPGSPRETGP